MRKGREKLPKSRKAETHHKTVWRIKYEAGGLCCPSLFALNCYIKLIIKTGKFLPEYAGKMNFYLSVLDKQVKGEGDNPSIGLILCKDRNKLVAEYALKDVSKPIGVSEYRLLKDVPEELQDTVPSLEDIESRVMNKYKCE